MRLARVHRRDQRVAFVSLRLINRYAALGRRSLGRLLPPRRDGKRREAQYADPKAARDETGDHAKSPARAMSIRCRRELLFDLNKVTELNPKPPAKIERESWPPKGRTTGRFFTSSLARLENATEIDVGQ